MRYVELFGVDQFGQEKSLGVVTDEPHNDVLIRQADDKEVVTCSRCGLPDFDGLHPDSLPMPNGMQQVFTVTHGDGEQCGEDRRAWVTEG